MFKFAGTVSSEAVSEALILVGGCSLNTLYLTFLLSCPGESEGSLKAGQIQPPDQALPGGHSSAEKGANEGSSFSVCVSSASDYYSSRPPGVSIVISWCHANDP